MKFQVMFKTPDVLDYILEENTDSAEQIQEIADKFIEYGEYITIEFDTDKQSATVVPLRQR